MHVPVPVLYMSLDKFEIKNLLAMCVCVCVCVYLGLTSLSTIFQSYHDGFWLRQGAQCSLL